MLSPEVFRDNRVLATDGKVTVLRECDAIELSNKEGATNLHVVQANGLDMMFHRALITERGAVVFKLTDVAMSLHDIAGTHPHDVPGLVKYTLRLLYRDKTHADLQADCIWASSLTVPLDPEALHAPEVEAA